MISIPKAKIKLRKWIHRYLGSISCDIVANEMKRNIVPKIMILMHITFFHIKNHPTYDSFLNYFRLEKIFESTMWRWMHCFVYTFHKMKKYYFTGRHKDIEIVTNRRKINRK